MLSIDDIQLTGAGLNRPECVLATSGGDLYTGDWRGGVSHILQDGTRRFYGGTLPGGRPLRPNGIALRRDGTFLIANLGETQGGVFVLDRAGSVRPFLIEVEGQELLPTNFVSEDAQGRVWITVSTRKHPRWRASRPDASTGFIVLADAKGARIVPDGSGYTNEALVSPDGCWL
jgi:sugar lactone lactonase YvrE